MSKKPEIGAEVDVFVETPSKKTYRGIVTQLLSSQFVFHEKKDISNYPMPRFCLYSEHWERVK